ncbi:hypothetical protein [Candidatus Similichlamydia epinepheli]|uniref:hypothetical protein n=1 Tax=Candidatus Similichlamydia epinepheli TaxID=1903953 RepID=UPI000D3345E0|nr:hypothetical protein [Candidatus Similichlamydia epinepheli]
MHFTREPIVETVITAREGAKLLVRNARGAEELDTYLVEAVEVVIFGGAVFYRSASRPSAFLVPVGEYEVIECNSNRSHLKKPSERLSRQSHRESAVASSLETSTASSSPKKTSSSSHHVSTTVPSKNWNSSYSQDVHLTESPSSKPKRVRSSSSRVKGRCPPPFPEEQQVSENIDTASKSNDDVVDRASKILASLIPPPSTLVSDTLVGQKKSAGQNSTSHQEQPRNRGVRSGSGKRGRFDRDRRKEID